MIVQAPDNKTIDFGSLPPDQVQAAMQRMYPPSGQQQAGNPPSQGEQSAPANTNNFGDDQGLGLLNQIRSAGVDQPNTTYGNILPFARNDQTGETSLALPEAIRSPIRGITELMGKSGGIQTPETDSGADRNQLSGDALSALTMLSPSSVALKSKMGFGSANSPDPIGNQLIKYANNLQPGAMGDVEDAAINQIMTPDASLPGSAMKAGFGARSPEELGTASDTMKSSAGDLYKQMRDVGATINGDAANNLASNVDAALKQNLFIPQLNPKTLGIVDHLKDAINQNGGIGLDELDQYRRLLGRVGGSEDGVSAGAVKSAIDSTVNGLTNDDLASGSTQAIDLLNKGRAAYSQASTFESVADVIAKANGDPNKIKQGLSNFLKSDSNTRFLNDDQISAIRYAANTGVGENVLKAFGKFGLDFSKTGLGNTALPALATMAGHAPLAVVGTIARQGQKYMARGKAEQLLDYLQNGGQQ